MKMILSLVFSLALAISLCLGLILIGVLSVRDTDQTQALETVKESGKTIVRRTIDRLPQLFATSPPSPSRVAWTDGAPEVVKQDGEAERQLNLVHQKVIKFLSNECGSASPTLQKRFMHYLTGDLGLRERDAQRIARMSFWKNFVTLQEFAPTAGENAAVSLQQEWEMKKAGFEALGLSVMSQEFRDAEERLKEMLASKGGGG